MSNPVFIAVEAFACFSLAIIFLVSALIPWTKYLQSDMAKNVKDGLPVFFCLCFSSDDRWKTTFLLALSSLLVSYGAYSFHAFAFLEGTAVFWMSLAIYFTIWTVLDKPRWKNLAVTLAIIDFVVLFLLPDEKMWLALFPMVSAFVMFHFQDDIEFKNTKKKPRPYWHGR